MSVISARMRSKSGSSMPLRAIFSTMLSGDFSRLFTCSIGLYAWSCVNSSRRIEIFVSTSRIPNSYSRRNRCSSSRSSRAWLIVSSVT